MPCVSGHSCLFCCFSVSSNFLRRARLTEAGQSWAEGWKAVQFLELTRGSIIGGGDECHCERGRGEKLSFDPNGSWFEHDRDLWCSWVLLLGARRAEGLKDLFKKSSLGLFYKVFFLLPSSLPFPVNEAIGKGKLGESHCSYSLTPNFNLYLEFFLLFCPGRVLAPSIRVGSSVQLERSPLVTLIEVFYGNWHCTRPIKGPICDFTKLLLNDLVTLEWSGKTGMGVGGHPLLTPIFSRKKGGGSATATWWALRMGVIISGGKGPTNQPTFVVGLEPRHAVTTLF